MNSEDFLKFIVDGLVEVPDQVKISRQDDELGVLLTISVPKSEMGKIIGRDGQMAKSIRQVMNGYGFTKREKISVKIAEPITS